MPLSSVGASLPGRREMMSPSTRRLTGRLINWPSRYVHCRDTAGKDGTNKSSVSFSQSEGGCSKKPTTNKSYILPPHLLTIIISVPRTRSYCKIRTCLFKILGSNFIWEYLESDRGLNKTSPFTIVGFNCSVFYIPCKACSSFSTRRGISDVFSC